MKRWVLLLMAIGAAYLATGFYVVRGNEKVAVRCFGKALRTTEGRLRLQGSGLHYALPWPFFEVDRVNLHELRTLTLGIAEAEDDVGTGFLRTVDNAGRSQYLTGDKNILHLQLTAQYHVSEEAADDYLFRSAASEKQFECMIEAVATDLVSRSGVDFVHPLGQVELNGLLTRGVRRLADEARLGLEVDDVTINAVSPPVLVKAYFLDVTNARADKVNFINEANAYAEQRRAAQQAAARQTLDEAAIYRQHTVESARARAESFTRMVEQLRNEAQSGGHDYIRARQMALNRRYLETMRDVLKTVSAKVLLDSGEPADLTIFSRPGNRRIPPETR